MLTNSVAILPRADGGTFPQAVRDLSASQEYGVFHAAINARAAGLYWLATGDMDAFDVMAACGEFFNESGAVRDANDHVTYYPYAWGDYWGPSETTGNSSAVTCSGAAMAAVYARRPQLEADAEDAWSIVEQSSFDQLGFVMQAVFNPNPDNTAPAAITTLAASQGSSAGEVDLTWNAPGDDGTSGTAWRYQIKYSTAPIVEKVTGWPDWTPPTLQTEQDWWDRSSAFLTTQRPFVSAINVLDLPTPAAANTQQSKTVAGLESGKTYYFRMKTLDDAYNLSAISNQVSIEAP